MASPAPDTNRVPTRIRVGCVNWSVHSEAKAVLILLNSDGHYLDSYHYPSWRAAMDAADVLAGRIRRFWNSTTAQKGHQHG